MKAENCKFEELGAFIGCGSDPLDVFRNSRRNQVRYVVDCRDTDCQGCVCGVVIPEVLPHSLACGISVSSPHDQNALSVALSGRTLAENRGEDSGKGKFSGFTQRYKSARAPTLFQRCPLRFMLNYCFNERSAFAGSGATRASFANVGTRKFILTPSQSTCAL